MSKDKSREFWIAMCTFNDGYTEIYECRDAEFDPTPPSEKVHVIEFSAYAALEAKLAECVAALNNLLPYAEHGVPEPYHFGSCSPETICDMNCSHAFHGGIAINNAREVLAKVKK